MTWWWLTAIFPAAGLAVIGWLLFHDPVRHAPPPVHGPPPLHPDRAARLTPAERDAWGQLVTGQLAGLDDLRTP